MSSTTALYTGLSGMTANARKLDVIGNNIANANTTAFKSSRMLFETAFAQTIRDGTQPRDQEGGTNPYQIGLGVNIAGTQRDFSTGSISATGDPRDLAIQGRGFFVTSRGPDTLYTRAGGFRQDAAGNLTNVEGDRLLGYGIDGNFNVQTGALQPLNIPVGRLRMAPQATKNVGFTGDLDTSGAAATHGASIVLGGTSTTGLSLIPGATRPATGSNLLETGSLLGEIADPLAPTAPLFAAGQQIEVRGAQRGGANLAPRAFTINAASTVQDLMNFLRDALGANSDAGPNPDGTTPGVSLNPTTGQLTINGNTGTTNDLAVDSSDVRVLDPSGAVRSPLDLNKTAAADGQSVKGTVITHDSLGNEVSLDVRMTLESKDNGTVWRYDVDSPTDSNLSTNVATGRLAFDAQGNPITTAAIPLRIDLAGTGAATPQPIDLRLDQLTASADAQRAFAGQDLDGWKAGTLVNFGVADDGTIVGAFDNAQTRPIGRVALATFINPEGLVDAGENAFRPGADSGPATLTDAGEGTTAGQVVSGALELSNVDLGQEFINMILTSTGYSASSRVIRTSDELLQQLLVLGR